MFGALWPEDSDFGAVVGDEEDIDALRAALAVVVFAVLIFVLVVIIFMVVTAALNNDRIGLSDLVAWLIVRPRRRRLEPG